MVIVVTVLLALAAVWAITRPLLALEPDSGSYESIETETWRDLVDKKERALRVLKDLELDYQTGKITENEFRNMKASMANEIATVLDKLEQSRSTKTHEEGHDA